MSEQVCHVGGPMASSDTCADSTASESFCNKSMLHVRRAIRDNTSHHWVAHGPHTSLLQLEIVKASFAAAMLFCALMHLRRLLMLSALCLAAWCLLLWTQLLHPEAQVCTPPVQTDTGKNA
jgi:hypothetical protein